MIRLVVLGAFAATATVIVAVARPGDAGLAVDVLVLFLGALAVAALAGRLRRFAPRAERSVIEVALAAPRPRPDRPDGLERIERRVVLGVTNAGDLNGRLAPFLRELAVPLLAVHGVDLERDERRARALVGDEGYEVLRAGLQRPQDPFAPGIPAERLADLVGRLEVLSR